MYLKEISLRICQMTQLTQRIPNFQWINTIKIDFSFMRHVNTGRAILLIIVTWESKQMEVLFHHMWSIALQQELWQIVHWLLKSYLEIDAQHSRPHKHNFKKPGNYNATLPCTTILPRSFQCLKHNKEIHEERENVYAICIGKTT